LNERSIKNITMPKTKQQFEVIRKESKQKILNAALEVFAKHGYHSSSVGLIAKTAGVSQGLLYNYFESKEELLHELMLGMMEALMCEFMPINPNEKVKRKDIISFINVGIDLVLKDPKFWKLYFSVFVQPDVLSIVMGKMMKMAEPYFKGMTEYFREKGIKDPVVMMRYFSAVMDGIQMHIMLDPNGFPAEEVKKLLIKQFA
jgi:AcrR family transcriptional regulator